MEIIEISKYTKDHKKKAEKHQKMKLQNQMALNMLIIQCQAERFSIKKLSKNF